MLNKNTARNDKSSKNISLNGMRALKLSKSKNSISNRKHTRHACLCLGMLSLTNRFIKIEGIITEVSKSGLKFKPAKTYLLERKNTPVSIDFANRKISGKIVNTKSDGYGIVFHELVDEVWLRDFLNNPEHAPN